MQDSLARAVADEMQKIYQSELGPQPVPLTVTGEAVDEEYVSNICSMDHEYVTCQEGSLTLISFVLVNFFRMNNCSEIFP